MSERFPTKISFDEVGKRGLHKKRALTLVMGLTLLLLTALFPGSGELGPALLRISGIVLGLGALLAGSFMFFMPDPPPKKENAVIVGIDGLVVRGAFVPWTDVLNVRVGPSRPLGERCSLVLEFRDGDEEQVVLFGNENTLRDGIAARRLSFEELTERLSIRSGGYRDVRVEIERPLLDAIGDSPYSRAELKHALVQPMEAKIPEPWTREP